MTAHPKPKVVKDPAYLKWVRQQHCWFRRDGGCNPRDTIGNGPSEASHLDTKSRDDRVLPMCGGCHRTNNTSWHHGFRTFCWYHQTTKADLIRQGEQLYAEWRNR